MDTLYPQSRNQINIKNLSGKQRKKQGGLMEGGTTRINRNNKERARIPRKRETIRRVGNSKRRSILCKSTPGSGTYFKQGRITP